MSYVFVTGGARSGKSAAAERRALSSAAAVTLIATAEAGDDEMAIRIARHRNARPDQWATIEEPVDLAGAIELVPSADFVVLDCLTLWVSNMLDRSDDEIAGRADEVALLLAARVGDGVVVSNEVGDGIVPADPLTRRYRDLLGTINRSFADRASEAYLAVAGRVLRLEPLGW
jgi:adenosyl cobinamide kinase/adenosyl cobinamide phosphate guanylyltransferase